MESGVTEEGNTLELRYSEEMDRYEVSISTGVIVICATHIIAHQVFDALCQATTVICV